MNISRGLEAQQAEAGEKTWLAITLLSVELLVFFGFIGMGAFSQGVLATPLLNHGTITVAFLYGMVVLIVSVVLTGLYVVVENRSDRT